MILKYPYILRTAKVAPIFGNQLIGKGAFLPLNDGAEIFKNVSIKDQKAMQVYSDKKMEQNNTNWAIAEFGEKRKFMFTELGHSQMVEQSRFFHLGLDVYVPKGLDLYAPLDGKVVLSTYEEGDGNYGGMLVLEHLINEYKFYTVFGHLEPTSLIEAEKIVVAGDKIAQIGDMSVNGGYFYHVHLQVLTEEGYKNGYVSKGYATEEDFKEIEKYCLNPVFLFVK